jgi:glycosidase
MLGSKPDERLRTPMQWDVGAGAGFTKGKPWERMGNDSAGIAVSLQEDDPTSLLSLYRRLIHLRSTKPALAQGQLIPLTASDGAVSAYVRRDGDRVAVVIVNLSDSALQNVSLTSAANALPAGGCTMRSLLGGANAAPMQVGNDGRLHDYVPLPTLAPLEGYLFELSACTKPH